MIDKKKNLELKKHVATIHSGNRLSLVQRKISNALLYNAYDDLLDKEEHTIHIVTLCKLIGYDSNDHKTIRKALVDLLSTVIEWNIVDGDRLTQGEAHIWTASSIIADASIDGAICTYSYSNKMKRLLHRPELYGRLNMVVQAKFKSSYGLALYENCIRYQDIGQTPWLEMSKFRKLMGVAEGTYKIFRDFKSRVLDKAVEEVNAHSAIHITPQLRKQGRQPIAIQFVITSNRKLTVGNKEPEIITVSEILKNRFGFSKRQTAEILINYQEEYIQEKIAIIEASPTFQAGKINNLAKYLLSAIEDDYQPVKSMISKVNSKRLEPNEHSKVINQIKKRYAAYRDQLIDLAFEKLSAQEKEKLMGAFFEKNSESINTVIKLQRKKYSRDNITESPQIKSLLRSFVVQVMPHKELQIQPIEKFIEQLTEVEKQVWKKSEDRVVDL
ncbi:MAG: RepB family plasmid replication initiator protein [Gammaproteobacteria bacterium]